MKTMFFSFLAFLICTALVSAETKNLKVWAAETDMTLIEVLQQYMVDHPDVKIDIVRKGGDYKQEQLLALQAGEAPDILPVNQSVSEMGLFADQGLVLPLTKYAEKYGWTKGLGASVNKPDLWDTQAHQLGQGVQYSAPHVLEFTVIAYNKTLFQKAKITKLPATWAELEVMNDQLLKAGITPFSTGITGDSGYNAIHQTVPHLYLYMTRSQIDNYTFARKGATFNLPEAVKGAKNLQDWVKKGYFNKGFEGVGWDDAEKNFMAGKSAMFMGGNWLAQDLTRLSQEVKTDWDVFAVPSPIVFGAVGTGLGISATSKNPDLAADVLNAVLQDYKIHVKWNNMPMNVAGLMKDPSVVLSPQFKSLLAIQQLEVSAIILTGRRLRPTTPGSPAAKISWDSRSPPKSS
jgi:raffinose/stachyose/melibiose transport system substrate-binding protein